MPPLAHANHCARECTSSDDAGFFASFEIEPDPPLLGIGAPHSLHLPDRHLGDIDSPTFRSHLRSRAGICSRSRSRYHWVEHRFALVAIRIGMHLS